MNLCDLRNEYNFDLDIDYKSEIYNLENQNIRFNDQFLKLFYLEEYNSSLTLTVEKLFNKIKDNELFKNWINQIDSNMDHPEDCGIQLMNFMLLFSFDTLQYTHNCLKSLEKNNTIDSPSINAMNNYFNK